MLRIKDQSGEIVRGAFRTEAGAIVIDDPISYGKYMKEKDRAMEVVRLNNKVNDLEMLVQRLISTMEDKK